MRQKHFWFTFAAALVLLLSATTTYGQIVAYDAAVQPGNQGWTGNLGLDFDVNTGKTIIVTALGAFDNLGNGFTGTVSVAIYNRATEAQVCGPVSISGTTGTLVNGDRFVALGTPCTLSAGNYSVVAVGFNATDLNGNAGCVGTSGANCVGTNPYIQSTENTGGSITFVTPGRFDTNTSLDFPVNLDPKGLTNPYLAGTFQFETPGAPTFTKTFQASFPNSGDVVPVVFTINNPNPVALTGASFTDTLPAGVTVAPGPISNTCGGTVTAPPYGNSISFSGGSIGPTSSCTITVPVTSSVGGPVTNTTGNLTTNIGTVVLTTPGAVASTFFYDWWLWFFFST